MIHAPVLMLRSATSEETDFWFNLYATTRAEELQAWGWDEMQQRTFLNLQFTAQQQAYQSHYPQRERSVIDFDGVAIGGMQVDRTDETIHLIDLAILPAYQRRGFGTQLLRNLCEEAQQCHQSVQLQVLKSSPAYALYTQLGFHSVADSDPYWQMEWSAISIVRT
jgi:ribosomal protein S18 acetylase RimI-like enzyme